MLANVGQVSYGLQLPDTAAIRPVFPCHTFHLSLKMTRSKQHLCLFSMHARFVAVKSQWNNGSSKVWDLKMILGTTCASSRLHFVCSRLEDTVLFQADGIVST